MRHNIPSSRDQEGPGEGGQSPAHEQPFLAGHIEGMRTKIRNPLQGCGAITQANAKHIDETCHAALERLGSIQDMEQHGAEMKSFLRALAALDDPLGFVNSAQYANAAVRDRSRRFPLPHMDVASLNVCVEAEWIRGKDWVVMPFSGQYFEIADENGRFSFTPQEQDAERQFQELRTFVLTNLETFGVKEWKSVVQKFLSDFGQNLKKLQLVPSIGIPSDWEDRLRLIANGNTHELLTYMESQLSHERILQLRNVRKTASSLQEILEQMGLHIKDVLPYIELPGGNVLVHMKMRRFGLDQWWVEYVEKDQFDALRGIREQAEVPAPNPPSRSLIRRFFRW